jgi:hypothetical protein
MRGAVIKGGSVRGRARVVGWGLVALAAIVVVAIVIAGALDAKSEAGFGHWGVWAGIAALFVALVGVMPSLLDKITGSAGTAPDAHRTEDELAGAVLAEAQVARSRLIGPGKPEDQAANVRFIRSSGRFREVGGAAEGDLGSVLEYYQSLSPGRLVVLGEPGSGKTVLALELQIRLLQARRQKPDMPIPVLIGAAACDTRQRWEEWLTEHLALRFAIAISLAKRLIRDGRVLPIVDGLDEMIDPIDGLERAQVLVEELNASIRGRERAPMVVTCRRSEYQVLVREADRATHIEMVPLAGAESAAYLREQFVSRTEAERWETVLDNLETDPDGPLSAQLATPWRLTLALTVFRTSGSPSELLPRTDLDHDRYTQRVDSLLLGEYVSSAVRLHGRDRRYTGRKVERWMSVLADGLARQYRQGGSGTDIILHPWWQPTGQRTMQTTRAVMAVAPGIAWIIVGAAIRDAALMWIGAASYGVAAAVASSPVSVPGQLKIRQLAARYSAAAVATGCVIGLAAVIAIWLKLGLTDALAIGVALGLAVGLGIELSDTPLRAPAGDGTNEYDNPSSRAYWRTIVRQIGGQGSKVRLEEFWMYGLVGLAAGLTLGLTLEFTLGARAWTRYRLTVGAKAIRGRGPLRFGRFADWATRAGLLRVSGIGYQFWHRQLQDFLTSTDGQKEQPVV